MDHIHDAAAYLVSARYGMPRDNKFMLESVINMLDSESCRPFVRKVHTTGKRKNKGKYTSPWLMK